MIILTESRPPQQGRPHEVIITPAPKPGCEPLWSINGVAVEPGDTEGGLRVDRIVGDKMIVTPVGNVENTTIEVSVNCPDGTGDSGGPLTVGGGTTDPCEQEPCKTARSVYSDAVQQALVTKTILGNLCLRAKIALVVFLLTLALFFAVIAALRLCEINTVFPTFCSTLKIALLVVTASMLSAVVWLATTLAQLYNARLDCGRDSITASTAYLNMLLKCKDRKCHLPQVKVDCEC